MRSFIYHHIYVLKRSLFPAVHRSTQGPSNMYKSLHKSVRIKVGGQRKSSLLLHNMHAHKVTIPFTIHCVMTLYDVQLRLSKEDKCDLLEIENEESLS